ncbi:MULTISPECIES: GPW/gp25 family protein [unclassified Streptomyces]|uniref:GPW/gp25 family protein n=1 Tax=unclassified Streptomyces TaxID=2593676 RepID=UPI002251CBC4|nr:MULTISPECIES: GPW/gp25 family protein [unclassified Streptomyces]MCX5328344.1 GPW/gp25 family protein [Streptomyces sp. NBC_00140]MCX5357760.1 GPW/gp25 family protein [Streptomyces sp. NBC_00124]
MNEAAYGRGLTHPFRLGVTGLSQSEGVRKVEESIRIILGTQHGQRVMRPSFGCDLAALAFAPNNATTANLARYYVADGLARWEPRIEVLDVGVDSADAQLIITITYRLRATQDVHNLVYPFYLEPAP